MTAISACEQFIAFYLVPVFPVSVYLYGDILLLLWSRESMRMRINIGPLWIFTNVITQVLDLYISDYPKIELARSNCTCIYNVQGYYYNV